ncbi:hypothetical protein LZU96_20065 (plasmid) [Pantoea agglomerans]|nr:hypothetical protein [Pantoea agglomerans]UIL54454.1 hypothetical protein LZU96_20065 [Pantoea agglomerans]
MDLHAGRAAGRRRAHAIVVDGTDADGNAVSDEVSIIVDAEGDAGSDTGADEGAPHR